jgi:predicted Zn-dependent protease
VFLSYGLLDVMNDDVLVAAVVHEMGHLLADGHMDDPDALAGASTLLDAEFRAD